jgi:RNA-binding protein with serine-rich domain 1
MPGGQIVVERLSKNVNEDHLFEIFGQFGPIYDLDLPMNRTCQLSPSLSVIASPKWTL